ncbi:putative membrane protein, partial [Vibrio harveyi]
ALKLLNQRHL